MRKRMIETVLDMNVPNWVVEWSFFTTTDYDKDDGQGLVAHHGRRLHSIFDIVARRASVRDVLIELPVLIY